MDYPGVGPQLAHLHDTKRVLFSSATDSQVIEAFKKLAKTEGILPAMESSHAVAYAISHAGALPKEHSMVVNISGRADKDIFIVAEGMNDDQWKEFIHSKSEQYGNESH